MLLPLNVSMYHIEFHEPERLNAPFTVCKYLHLDNNQINARALIGQSAVGYCAGKPTEKSRAF